MYWSLPGANELMSVWLTSDHWWTVDTRSQGISSEVIDLALYIPTSAPNRLSLNAQEYICFTLGHGMIGIKANWLKYINQNTF